MGRCLDVFTSPACPVVIAIFLHSMFIIGIVKAMGILLEDMSTSLNTTVTEFGVSIGTFTLCCFMPAPVVAVVFEADRCPRRIALFVASSLMCIGVALASFASATGHVTVCLSLSGLGFSILQVYLAMILNERTGSFNLLYTLACSGYGAGMILPPLVAQLLLTAYGWRGALLLLGTIMANMIPCVLVIQGRYTHPEYPGKGPVRKKNSQMPNNDLQRSNIKTPAAAEHGLASNIHSGSVSDHQLERNAFEIPPYDCGPSTSRDISLQDAKLGDPQDQSSNEDLETADIDERTDLVTYSCNQSTSTREKCYPTESGDSCSGDDSSDPVYETKTNRIPVVSHSRKSATPKPATTALSTNNKTCNNSPLRYRSLKSEHSDDEIKSDGLDSQRSLHGHESGNALEDGISRSEDASATEGVESRTCSAKIRDVFLDSPIYIDPWGNFAYLSLIVYMIVYIGWHGFLVPHALERGFTPYFTLIITTLAAVGNFSGRVLGGIFTHRLISPPSLFLIMCPINALALLVYTFMTDIIAMSVISFVSGAAIAMRAKLPKLTGRERTPDKYHYVLPTAMLCSGLGAFIGGFVSGAVADHYGSYDAVFQMLAGVEVIVFLTMLPVRLAKKPKY